MPTLTIHGAGPGLTVQDLGRPGWKAQGLSSGGAVDRLALFEAAALLGTSPGQAVIEMMGFGGTFHANADTRIALTGAEMQADIDGTPIAPNRTHLLTAGAMLNIGSARAGLFGYLAFAGGIMTAQIMDSRATHLTAGIGKRLEAGEALPFGADPDRSRPAMRIAPETRFTGGAIRIMVNRQNNELRIAVRDSGVGIPSEALPRLAQPFEQVAETSDRNHQGTGLGLSLTKSFAELHGGRLTIASEEGKGTMVSFYLPLPATGTGIADTALAG